jgi:hypothetical protein
MRDRTASRRYSPAAEEFRRTHEPHRAWGLTQRHAERLRRRRGTTDSPPTLGVSGPHPPDQTQQRPPARVTASPSTPPPPSRVSGPATSKPLATPPPASPVTKASMSVKREPCRVPVADPTPVPPRASPFMPVDQQFRVSPTVPGGTRGRGAARRDIPPVALTPAPAPVSISQKLGTAPPTAPTPASPLTLVSVPVGQGLALVRAAAIPAPSLAEVLLLFEQQIGLVPPPARGRCEKRIGAVLSLRPLAALQARGCAHAVGPRAVAELGPRAVAERRRCGFGRNVRELDFGRDPALKRSQLSSTVAETLERATNLSAPGPGRDDASETRGPPFRNLVPFPRCRPESDE